MDFLPKIIFLQMTLRVVDNRFNPNTSSVFFASKPLRNEKMIHMYLYHVYGRPKPCTHCLDGLKYILNITYLYNTNTCPVITKTNLHNRIKMCCIKKKDGGWRGGRAAPAEGVVGGGIDAGGGGDGEGEGAAGPPRRGDQRRPPLRRQARKLVIVLKIEFSKRNTKNKTL